MELHQKAFSWLYNATWRIHFREDREEVQRELREHLEDEILAVQEESGISQDEAEEIVVKRMGDAAEVGKNLAAVHTPWMGLLWRLSKVMIVLAAVCLVISLFRETSDGWPRRLELWDFDGTPSGMIYLDERQTYLSAEEAFLPGENPDQLLTFDCGGEREKIGPQTVKLIRGALWRIQEGQEDLFLYIRVDDLRFWEVGRLANSRLTVSDSSGNTYTSVLIEGNYGPFHSEYVLRVWDFDRDSGSVRIDYGDGAGGSTFSFEADIPNAK